MSTNTRQLFLTFLGSALLWISFGKANAATPMASLGEFHALALRADGTVLAWGSDTYGQLGLGRPLISTVPVKVPGLSNVRAIAGGQHHSLAVRQDGTVWAWGANGQGQLGDGTTLDRSSPVQVPGVTNAVMACGGGSHSAALKQDGTVWTWGTNTSGQLGNGIAGGEWWSTPPGPVIGLTGATAIACAGEQTFALLQNGTVRAWGGNPSGQLGDGTTTLRALPVQVSGLGNVKAINGTAALKQDGTVWEWGFETCCGQVAPNLVPVQSAGISDAVALGASLTTIFGTRLDAIKSDGVTWWEWNRGLTPTVQAQAGTLTAAASSAGHTLLLKTDGTVLAAGDNDFGQVGNGILPSSVGNSQSSFEPVIGLANVVALATGESHSLALDANGNVWAWGDDASGQLGRGGTLATTVPTVVPGLSNIVQVSAGGVTSLAVDQSGSVWAWGNNYHGQLGDGTSANRSAPVRLDGIQNVQTIAASMGEYSQSSLALKRDGTVWTWGNNDTGANGNGTIGGWSTLPAEVPGLANVTAIAASFHMLAVKQDGTVWAWGSNSNGELGLGTTIPSAVPVKVPGLSGVKAVTAAGGSTFAVKTDGTVMAWGAARTDALGDGTWCDECQQFTPKAVPGLTNVVEVAFGFSHGLARRGDGSVWAWGMGGSSMGSIPSGAMPVPIPNLAPMQQISASGGSSALLGQDGLLYMGGLNSSGQLGDGTFTQHPDFVLAVAPTLNGYLNLSIGSSTNVPAALRVPFFVSASGGITDASAVVKTTTGFNTTDVDKHGAVYITARAPAGSLGGSSQPHGSVSVPQKATKRPAAAIASAKASAATAAASVLMQLTPSGWQPVTNGQLIPYASGVLGDQLAAQTILDGTDTTSLKGAEFCLGYGTGTSASAAEMGAAGRMRTVATIPDPNVTGAASIGCLPLTIPQGWSLLGNGLNQSFQVASLYGDATWVTSVWKWDAGQWHWQFYAPLMDAATLQSFTAAKGYGILSEIQPGEGYWVNATAPGSVLFASGSPYTLTSASLTPGWNLAATAATVTPATFNVSLSATPPAAGTVPNNLISLWAWDNSQSKWYFYAPSLDAQGGAALTDYIGSHGYRDFTAASKTLGNGTGFWVNR